MSTSFTFNITDSFTGFVEPQYPVPVFTRGFTTEEEYCNWVNAEPKKHCTFRIERNTTISLKPNQQEFSTDAIHQLTLVCTYEGHARIKCEEAEEERPLKKSRKSKGISKKIGCPVRLTKNTLRNGMVIVNYKWKHEGHNPANIEEALREKLSPEVKQWIEDNVDKNMNWFSIKSILRLNEENIKKVNNDHIWYLLFFCI